MDDRQPVSLARRALSYLICYLVAVQPMLPAMAAQITPVTPGTKMDAAANGVPVVNIGTPNAAGVSHNQYQQYNVGQQGLILNNATGQLTQTQLGGLIQNNPNLQAGHEAQAIINEVTGANRSQLQGYTEVAGKAANVIVANPYGITCNGCGFINTPNVTLTTGKPQLDANGNLSALDVTKGSVTVEGKGLDGSGADAVSIVARATEINAGIHAKDLSVTVGANRVGADGSVTAIAGEGAAPSVAVDTGALGGMYANRIHLVSSEKGVGVNLGNLAAKQGDIQLDANGKLTLSNSLSSGALTANGASVALNGDNKATGQITVSAQQEATLGKGTLVSDDSISVKSSGTTKLNDTSLTAGKDLVLQSNSLDIDGGSQINANGNIALAASGNVSNSGEVTAGNFLSIKATTLTNNGSLAGKKTLTSETSKLKNSGKVVGTTLTITGDTIDNSGTILAGDRGDIITGQLTQTGTINALGDMNILATGAVANKNSISGNHSLAINSLSLDNAGTLNAPSLSLFSPHIINRGLIQGDESLILHSSDFDNLAGASLTTSGDLSLSVPRLFNAGLITTHSALDVEGDQLTNSGEINAQSITSHVHSFDNASGRMLAKGTFVSSGSDFKNSGVLDADEISLNSDTVDNEGSLQAGTHLSVKSDSISNGGTLTSKMDLSLQGETLSNSGSLSAQDLQFNFGQEVSNRPAGQVIANNQLSFSAPVLKNFGLLAASDLALTADTLSNGGTIQGSQSAILSGTSFSNLAEGQVLSEGQLTLQHSTLSNAGLIQGNALELTADRWDNAGNALGQSSLKATVTGSVTNQGDILGQQSVSLQAASTENSGNLLAKVLTLRSDLQNSGLIQATSDLSWQGATFANAGSGSVLAGETLSLSGASQQNKGALQGNHIALTAENISNSGEIQTGEGLTATASDKLENTGSAVSQGVMALNAAQLETSGKLAANSLTLSAGSLTNNGILQGNNALTLTTPLLINHSLGQIITQQDLSLTPARLENDGVIQTDKGFLLNGTDLFNNGTIQADLLTLRLSHSLDNLGRLFANRLADLSGNQINNAGDLTSDTLTLAGSAVANSGHIQTQANADIAADSITNAAGGKLLSGGGMSLNATSLQNDGVVQGSTLDLSSDSAASSGTLNGLNGVTGQFSTRLLNSGTFQSDGALDLTAASLTNSGRIAGTTLSITGSTLNNSGLWQGANGLSLTADTLNTLQGSRTLSGGALSLLAGQLNTDGTWQSTQGDINADDWQNSGTFLSLGSLTGNVSHALTSSGDISSQQALAISADTLKNQGQILSAADVTLNGQALDNQGMLQGQSLVIHQTSVSNSGTLTGVNGLTMGNSTLPLMRARVAAVSAPKELINTGSLLTDGTLTLHADSITNSGTLQGHDVNVDARQLIHSGMIKSADTLQLHLTDSLKSQSGSKIIALGSALLQAPVLLNQGEWSAKSLAINGDALTNAGKVSGVNSLNLALSGDASQQAGGTLLTAGELAVGAANISNDGSMQGGTLTLTAGNLTNNGMLQGDNGASLNLTGQVINNASARVISGNGLTLTTPTLMNYGLIQSASDSNLSAQAQIRNDGRLLSGTTLRVNAPQYAGSGLVQATSLLFSVANATNSGTLLADTATLSGASLSNQATVQAGDLAVNYDQLNNTGTVLGTALLNVKANQVTQSSAGKLFSAGNLLLTSGGVDASGQLVALKNLTLQLSNAFTGKAAIAAGSALNISSQGAIDNQSTMQGNAITLKAGAQLTNSGQISIGNGSSSLSGSSVLMNGSGTMQAGGDVTITSLGDMTLNGFTGTLGSLTLSAPGTIVNTALLYAANNLALYANLISNQRGDILAGNNLQLQRDAAGNANSQITNTSGSIETQNGDITIKTGHLLNTRDGLSVQQSTTQNTTIAGLGNATLKLPYTQMADGTWGYYSKTGTQQIGPCNGHGACSYNKVTNYYYAPFADYVTQKFATSQTSVSVVSSGGAARIAAGRDLTLQASSLDNQASNILANQNISMSGSQLNNQSWQAGTSYDYLLYKYAYERNDGTPPVATLDAATVVPTKPKVNTVFFKLSGHETDFTPGELYRSVIQAGGNVTASFASDISNSTTSANAGRITNTIGTPTLNRLSNRGIDSETQKQGLTDFTPVAVNSPAWRDQLQDALQQVNGGGRLDNGAQGSESIATVTLSHNDPADLGKLTALKGAGVSSAALKQTTIGQPVAYQSHSVDTSAYPVPSGNSGYFVVSDDKRSPYLITLNPKLDGLGKLDPALFGDLNALLGNQPAAAPQETRSQYTDVNQFLGSSYLLGRLNLKPDQDYRFLGDAAFDTRYVSNAILNETGSRYLNGVGSDLQQMQQLMDNAAAAQQSLGLQFGVSLSADQVAGLDHSILWWESTTINGEQVMVPKLYLAPNDITVNNGSVIAANNVDMQGGTISNDGSTLQASNSLILSSQNSISNLSQALIKAGGDLSLSASGDINNVSSIISGKSVALESVNGSINNITQADQFSMDTGGVSLQQTSLGNTAAISADDSLSLNAGKDITLSGSKLTAGNDLLMNAWGNIAVNANQVNDSSSSSGFRGQTNTTSSAVHSQGSIIDAGGSLNIEAGKDLSLTASKVHSGADTTLAAGQDLDLNSMATLDNSSKGNKETHTSGADRTSVSSGGNLTLTAGQDLTSQAAALAAEGNIGLKAGRDINLNAAESRSGNSERGSNKTVINETVRQQGTEIVSGGSTTLLAGNDITSQAATVTASKDLALQAGHDVNITTATESDYAYKEETKTHKGLFSKKTTHTVSEDSSTTEKASSLSGDHVSIVAGHDLAVSGSSVIGESDVGLKAGNDLSITAATETQSNYRLSETKKSGMFSGGGIGVTFGSASSKQQLKQDGTTESQSASTIGSTGRNVTLVAGHDAHIAGSDVIAKQDISVAGGSVTIDPGNDTLTRRHSFEQKQSGLTLQLTSPITDALLSLGSQAKEASEAGDDRLKALGALKTLESGWAMSKAATQSASALANGNMKEAGIKISLSVGASKSKSSSEYSSNTVSGSSLNGGGTVAVVATGANGTSGDVTLAGSGITGNNVTLAAAHDLNLVAASNNTEQKSSNKASGWSAGVHVAIGQRTGIGVQASGYMASGSENGSSTEYLNSRVNAKDNLTLSSGNDTLLSGAQALGNSISVNAGNNLTLTSLQDTDSYQSQQQSASGGFSFTFGTMNGSFGLSLSKSKVNSEYASVGDQSGLFAGNDGYDIFTGNHTQLNGAVIASTADAANNRLSTGTLGWDNIGNHAEYTAKSSSIGISGGYDSRMPSGQQFAGSALPAVVNMHESASGTTRSAVADGTITVRNEQNQKQDVAGLSRDTENANGHIGKIFDKEKVANQMAFAQGVQELAGKVVGDVKAYKLDAASDETKARLLKEHPDFADLPPEQLNEKIQQDPGYQSVAAQWGTGGSYSMAATAVAGVLGGLSANNLGAAAGGAMAPYIANAIKQATTSYDAQGNPQTNVLANTMAHAVAGAVLAQISGNSAAAGAAGAAGGELAARAIVKVMYPDTQISDLTETQKQMVSTLSQIAAGLAGGIASDSSMGGGAGAGAGKNAVENNALSVPQIEGFAEKAKGCEVRGDCGQIVKEMEDLSLNQQKEMIAVCATDTTACKEKYGDIPANGMLVRKALDSLFDADVPSQMKNDISSFWAQQMEAEGVVSSTEFASQLQSRYGIDSQQAEILAGAVLGAVTGGMGKGGKPGPEAAGKNIVIVDSGKKGAWNKAMNNPEPNTVYKVDGNKTFQTDASGRTSSAEGTLVASKSDRNTYQQCKAGKCGNPGDEGGHLIASIFNGPGEKLNLVPMDGKLNKGVWRQLENTWANALNDGKQVNVKVEPVYIGDSKRPDSFSVTYSIDGGRPVIRDISNTPGGTK